MKWSYNASVDALYAKLADLPPARQVELEDGTVVDVAADGSVVGIEVVSARAGWNPDLIRRQFAMSDYDFQALVVTTARLGVRYASEPEAVQHAIREELVAAC